jgi:hypothetical protein
MRDITPVQREALMALKDGPIPVATFNASHFGPDILALIPMLIEFGGKGTFDDAEVMAWLTQEGHSALALPGQARAAAKAAGLAAQMIDFLGDQSASAGDRQSRKDRLLTGPLDFVKVRHDVTGTKG